METPITSMKVITRTIVIKGLGNDIIEIERVSLSIKKHGNHFLKKLFTEDEISYCLRHKSPETHFSGRFAAKEAIAKALGTGFGKSLSWLDISILPKETGAPVCIFSDAANEHFGNPKMMLSISHSKYLATAVAIWVE